MFFYIGKNCPIQSVQKKADNIFLDQGWEKCSQNNNDYWYKGYSTDCTLQDSIDKIIEGYKPRGKWAIVSSSGNIYHPILRGFPVYTNNQDITNIPLDNFEYVSYNTFKITKSENTISLVEAAQKINEILKENVINFFKYNIIDRLNILFSGGIDTLTVWAIIDNLGYDYDLHIHTPKGSNIFGIKQEYKSDLIDLCRNKFWGYKMTSCFSQPNYYATGFYSERMQIREVTQGHAIANFKGKKLHESLKSTDYLYWFLNRPANKINNEPKFTTEKEVLDWCNNSIFYDHQMWHIDNNYHFSPFFDIKITEVMNGLSLDDISFNAFDATIQKNIIKLNRPDFLQILSDYKNERNIWANYNKNFKKIVLRDKIKKILT
jgi:hypothetical protein